jgi:hypothetical protein
MVKLKNSSYAGDKSSKTARIVIVVRSMLSLITDQQQPPCLRFLASYMLVFGGHAFVSDGGVLYVSAWHGPPLAALKLPRIITTGLFSS